MSINEHISEIVRAESARRRAIEEALIIEALSDPDLCFTELHIVHQDGHDPSIASWWYPP